jgi:Cu-Zn family superoxide dismutase
VHVRHSSTRAGFHGLHIHANDVTSNGDGCIADATQPSATWFVSADGHWKHDPAELHGQHAGDLPSVYVNADGSASIEFDVDKLRPSEVVGRAVVLHVGPDNFGNVPVGAGADQYTPGATALAKTQATGNAGDRYACGVIGRH